MVACSAFLMALASPRVREVVEAEKFVLKDIQGKVRAEFEVINENAVLNIYNTVGTTKLSLGVLQDTPTILLMENDEGISGAGKTIGLFVYDGEALFSMMDAQFNERLHFCINDDGTNVSLMNDFGTPAILMTSFYGERPSLVMLSRQDLWSHILSYGDDGPFIQLIDRDGKAIWRAP